MVERRPDKTEVEGSIPSMPTVFDLFTATFIRGLHLSSNKIDCG